MCSEEQGVFNSGRSLSPDPVRLGEFLERVATGGDAAAPGGTSVRDTPWRAKEISYDEFNKLGNSLLAHLGADKSVLNHERGVLQIPALHAVCCRGPRG